MAITARQQLPYDLIAWMDKHRPHDLKATFRISENEVLRLYWRWGYRVRGWDYNYEKVEPLPEEIKPLEE